MTIYTPIDLHVLNTESYHDANSTLSILMAPQVFIVATCVTINYDIPCKKQGLPHYT